MNMMVGLQAIHKKPVFRVETHSEKSVKGRSRSDLAFTAKKKRQEIAVDLIKNNPLTYSAKDLSKVVGVSQNTVRSDLAEIKKVKKGNRAGVMNKYYFRGSS